MTFVSFMQNQQAGAIRLAVAIFSVFFLTACMTVEEKCTEVENELTDTFNAYIDEKPGLTAPQIMRQCKRALEQCPDLAIAYELMGMVELERKHIKACLRNYTKSIELEPSNEDLLSEARGIMFLKNGKYLYINDAGRVKAAPYKTITVEEYAELPDDARMVWCTAKLGIIPEEKTEYVFTDQNGNHVDSMEFGWTEISPSDLDARLLSEAQSNPDEKLSEAAFLITAESLSYGRVD